MFWFTESLEHKPEYYTSEYEYEEIALAPKPEYDTSQNEYEEIG
jgi:hypothetical protein